MQLQEAEGQGQMTRKQKRQQKNDEYWAARETKKQRTDRGRRGGPVATPAEAASTPNEPLPPYVQTPYTLNLRATATTNMPLTLSHRYTAVQPLEPSRRLPHGCFLKSCKWSPDGASLLTNGEDNVLRVFNIPDSVRGGGAPVEASEEEAAAVCVEAGYRRSDAEMRGGNAAFSALDPALAVTEGECVYDYAWFPKAGAGGQDNCFLTSSREHPIHLWDAASGSLRATYRGYNDVGEPTSPYSLCFSPDGAKILAGYKSQLRYKKGLFFDIRCKPRKGLHGWVSSSGTAGHVPKVHCHERAL